MKYPVKLGDEAIVAPMSLFHPELLGIMGPQLVRTQGRCTGDPEDPHDEFYLQMTSREVRIWIVFSWYFYLENVLIKILY